MLQPAGFMRRGNPNRTTDLILVLQQGFGRIGLSAFGKPVLFFTRPICPQLEIGLPLRA